MHPVLRRALVRLFEIIPVLWVVVTLTFLMVRWAPGGPFDTERALTPEAKKHNDAYYGLDKPLFVQYEKYLSNFLHGDLGTLYRHPDWSVNELLAQKAPVSAELGLWATLVALVIGLGTGVIAASRPRSKRDYGTMAVAMIAICLPSFVLGPILLLVFGLKLQMVNVMGWNTVGDRVLPSLVLGLYYAAYIARLTRGSMLEVRAQDFIRTARAKGNGSVRILLVHMLRNALGPIIAYLAPTVAGLVTGSFVVESIFQIPGIGRMFVEAALNHEDQLLLGVTVLFSAILLFCNWLGDVLITALNPKAAIE
ncbi:MAG TPA: ABC transporter permease subunit [Opitutales bacterium]|jgi:oligopeptide transport system permease protein|nr:ABC transporter permease subunit [Opitutales bacterium]